MKALLSGLPLGRGRTRCPGRSMRARPNGGRPIRCGWKRVRVLPARRSGRQSLLPGADARNIRLHERAAMRIKAKKGAIALPRACSQAGGSCDGSGV